MFLWDSIRQQQIQRLNRPPTGPVCLEELLHEVQSHHVFPDSKEFVDMPMKYDPHFVFDCWKKLNKKNLTKQKLYRFVKKYFHPAGSDTETFSSFPDYEPNPPILKKIKDPKFKQWAKKMNELWPVFGRFFFFIYF